MEGFKGFSTEANLPSKSEVQKQAEVEWAEHGGFVPTELRAVADQVFNSINRSPESLEDLPEAARVQYLEKLRAYSAMPAGPNAIKDKKAICKAIEELFD